MPDQNLKQIHDHTNITIETNINFHHRILPKENPTKKSKLIPQLDFN